MRRNLSPVVRRQLENLDKDSDSRKFAMKALKSYVKDLDSKAIPIFLAQVSETKETGLTSGEYTISLYEVLARVHGPKIVPQIDNIMLTIIKTLTSSAGSFALHQACSKVVPAIARYGMDPTTPDAKKSEIIHSLCKPLSDSLLSSQENLSSGAALCLKALVESDNWRFSSSQMVNEVCQRVAAALEKPMQANSHIGLVMALAKHNGSDVEGYARLLVRAGVGILNMGLTEGNSQKRLSAIQMVNFLMRSLDYKCIMSELHYVIEEFQKCQSDQMAYVKGAAFEAIQTAKRILTEKGSKREHRSVSPRSQTIESFGEYSSSISYSPILTNFASRDSDPDSRSINRKLWRNVDVSLKDGLFSGDMGTPRSVIDSSETQEDYDDEFSGFMLTPTNGVTVTSRSATPSPQKSRSYVNIDNTDLFTTPKKLVKSLQVSNSDCSENQSRRFRSPPSSKFNWSPNSSYGQSGFNESFTNENEQFNGASESVSSTEDIMTNGSNNLQLSQEPVPETKVKSKVQISLVISIASALFVLIIAVVCFLWMRDLDDGYDNLVPT
ncbi:putative armadillo-like helical protein [Helianthus annuus]|uniref:Armadillo-like helical protein n=2 Tax=Helianthus annuus TaxID=4232 RepID=A0A9K3JZ44_HELAN|nr:protein SINE1 [Helianthus annuus]KAF5823317.1 putative armadillo-like helical protein [Helianthus annuus]KAJ0628047.1 putative armadillo-like helical protein [Helianthus annuus]KAJ0949366.1 putative armadillo-like helical protein [Helianthus annuus]